MSAKKKKATTTKKSPRAPKITTTAAATAARAAATPQLRICPSCGTGTVYEERCRACGADLPK